MVVVDSSDSKPDTATTVKTSFSVVTKSQLDRASGNSKPISVYKEELVTNEGTVNSSMKAQKITHLREILMNQKQEPL